MNTTTEPEEELSFTEDFANIEAGSDFAIFVFTYIGILVGLIFSIEIDGFLIGGYNVGKIIIFVIWCIIGFKVGTKIKQLIDESQRQVLCLETYRLS